LFTYSAKYHLAIGHVGFSCSIEADFAVHLIHLLIATYENNMKQITYEILDNSKNLRVSYFRILILSEKSLKLLGQII